ncbi:CAP domain-containing protein [Streptomyces sp. NPDC053048]|uniref:CAP domain-containing protein n=1 Tax=Streptomyces sp. NPDC053048 TaxID=3365694 RepID=UPI0037D062DB
MNARKATAPLTNESAPAYEPEDPAEAVTQPIPVIRTGPTGPGRHRSPRRRGGAAKSGTKTGKAARTGRAGTAGKVVKAVPPARRTGLLGASAAVAMGAVAMVSGLLPTGGLPGGGDGPAAGGGSGQILADGPIEVPEQRPRPSATTQADRAHEQEQEREERARQARTAREAVARNAPGRDERQDGAGGRGTEEARVSRGAGRPAPSAASAPPSAVPTGRRTGSDEWPHQDGHHSPTADGPHAAERDEVVRAAAHGTLADPQSAAAHLVLSLVNAERAKAGCRPLRASSKLNRLAQSMSDDMARRGFFDHTDPDGRSPWDRAARRGIKNLGGENIARGHPDAHTVMEAWMRSSGHRANILNCDYRSIGVGVHHGGNGPWWTQDFGY